MRCVGLKRGRTRDDGPVTEQAGIRVVDEVITFVHEAKLESRQVWTAMTGMGMWQHLIKKENVIVSLHGRAGRDRCGRSAGQSRSGHDGQQRQHLEKRQIGCWCGTHEKLGAEQKLRIIFAIGGAITVQWPKQAKWDDLSALQAASAYIPERDEQPNHH